MVQFCCGGQGIRSLNRWLTAVILKGLDDDEDKGYYSSLEDESEISEDTARRSLGKVGSVTIANPI